jgi:inhibitor of KinA sporulation pathway (predicted exonuclease)
MNYIVLDIEFNQPTFFGKKKFIPNPIAPFEIIEIGAAKLDENLNIIDTFGVLIKPKIYKMLSPIVSKKTRIKKEDLENGVSFCSALKLFKEWIENDYILCTWGNSDITEMKRNCRYHNIKCLNLENYIDIQRFYMFKYKLPVGQQIGLKTAINNEEIAAENKFHRALNDAVYTGIVFQNINDKEVLNEYMKREKEIEEQKIKVKKVFIRKKETKTNI